MVLSSGFLGEGGGHWTKKNPYLINHFCLFLYVLFSPSSLNKSLAQAQEKIHALEEQLDQLLKTKNAAIHELESLVRRREKELQLAIEKVEEMRETLEHRRGEGEGEGERGEGWEREMASLLESISALNQQLMAALEQCR